jgi:HAD superfamily hydrolase (TIGR01490 family)
MERLRSQVSAMCTGWDVATVHDIVRETLHEIVDPLVYAEAADLIEEHRAAGREIVLVSSSGAEVVEPIGAMLGADRVIATRLEIVDGRYTGEIDYYAYGEEKANAVRAYAAEKGFDLDDCYGYSDSVTDLPMLEAVGHPHVVNPDKELRRIAAQRDWPVLVFVKPVALQSRLPLPPAKPTLAALAVGGVVAVGAAVWVGVRRRSTA